MINNMWKNDSFDIVSKASMLLNCPLLVSEAMYCLAFSAIYPFRLENHDPVTQDNPQTLLWVVSCWNYFLSRRQTVVLVDSTKVKQKSSYKELLTTGSVDYLEDHYYWKDTLLLNFSNVFFGVLSTTTQVLFSPIIFERGRTFLPPISPKLCNSHLILGWTKYF